MDMGTGAENSPRRCYWSPMPQLHIPDVMKRRAISDGPEGAAWIEALPALVESLAADWHLTIGAALSGGTEGLLVEAVQADGSHAVLKLCSPASGWVSETGVLLAAGGLGYTALLRHDPGRRALLLERLGSPLSSLGLSLDEEIVAICATLQEAWRVLPGGQALMTGADKAGMLAELIETTWKALEGPCPRLTIDRALRFAEARGRAFDPDHAVLVHGDAHGWNTLQVPGDPGRFKFVDPDGLLAEPAYDLAIPMREWSEALAVDPLALGMARCARLAALTGVAPEPIWQWGLVERVSTGLLCLQLDIEGGADILAVANVWAQAPAPF
jgi:streptomycin 6-kinase